MDSKRCTTTCGALAGLACLMVGCATPQPQEAAEEPEEITGALLDSLLENINYICGLPLDQRPAAAAYAHVVLLEAGMDPAAQGDDRHRWAFSCPNPPATPPPTASAP